MIESAVVVGCGSAGSRIANLLLKIGVTDVVGVDPRAQPFATWPSRCDLIRDEAIGRLAISSSSVVCDARPTYLRTADNLREYLRMGAQAVFVEKALGPRRESVALRSLVAEAEASGTVTQVGYCWQFHPIARAFRDSMSLDYANTKMGFACASDYRTWPGNQHTYDADVLVEYSHELHLAQWMLGRVRSVRSEWNTPHRVTIRLSHVTGAHSVVDLDWTPGVAYGRTIERVEIGNRLHWSSSVFDDGGMYEAELRAFLLAAERREPSPLPWRDGLDVLKTLEFLL